MMGDTSVRAGRSTRPEASVVIACYDSNATLGLQLEALAVQADAPPFEVVVADNMSTDPPDRVIARFTSRLDVRVVRADEAQGVACARNVGVREARAEKIVICDADDCVGPRFVRAAVEALELGDVVTGQVITLEASEFDLGTEHVWAELARRATPGVASVDVVDRTYPVLMGGASAMRRSTLVALGGFDQAFVPGAEDNDLALRTLAAGYDIVTAFDMTVAERRRATTGQAFRRSYDGGRMHMRLCATHDLWKTSPHLHDPEWWVDLAKLPAAVVKEVVQKRGGADWWGLASRSGLRLGQAAGYWRFEVRGARAERRLGVGLGSGGFETGGGSSQSRPDARTQ